ncbi:DUF4900 domain-containing protein [Deinococcus cellulosilyticus]|uniref:DUF4900 domain-containing protein n=1 Tax=Deinococcus cellulosilyticus (strain DSM 18568 / NBRC 106333 / KACC 11606 / 5516J-15) TaxID=1223518 RepID=A0A511N2C1_DEIC1|nr:DUF4900 domain-containing protein [Deinococcus cellulosilyticus]GEM47002.1 hypothetical protein DC3_26370 [Deinococcus cellulosilyticus NBRC 106333 = KACC 11606]
MNNNKQGFVLVSTLAILTVIVLLGMLSVANTTSEYQQSASQTRMANARAVSEAGQAEAQFFMVNDGLTKVNDAMKTYLTAFAASSKNAATDPIIDSSNYNAIITSLNGNSAFTRSGTINGNSYATKIKFSNMRADSGSFSSAGQDYWMEYVIETTGNDKQFKRNVITSGNMLVRLGRTYLNQFVLLADDGGSTGGNYYATGMNYDGPVHVNKNWRFAGSPQFKYGATTNAATVEMWNCTTKKWTAVSTQSHSCTSPDWGGRGMKYQEPKVDLPKNSFSQQRAALGLDPNTSTVPTQSQICTALGSAAPTGCNSSLGNGVYVPNNGSALTGGIYIQGNAKQVQMSVNAGKQVYTIKDANDKITTITVDYTANTTTIQPPTGSAQTLTGIPNGQLYANGQIVDLRGPARTGALPSPAPENSTPSVIPPAVASKSQLNIAAANDVIIQGDLVYETDPRTDSSAKNVMGIISGTGSVRIGTSAPNDIYIHAAILAGNTGKGFAVDDYNKNAPRGSIHLLGSIAEQSDPPRGVGSIGSDGVVNIVNGYGDGFKFDMRFMNGGTVPPFYPATTAFAARANWPEQQSWRED